MQGSVCEGARRGGVRPPVLIASVAVFVLGPPVGAQGVGTEISRAFRDGEFSLDFRYRYEFVDQAGFPEDANASTLQTRLAYTSAPLRGFALTLNVDNVHAIGADDYNSTRNGKTRFPRVADPTGTDLNLASVSYTGLEGATIVVGRQDLVRGNGRFVGDTMWRQNETTYDAASISYDVSERLNVFYGYADRVKRLFGPDPGSPSHAFGGPIHLLDATYTSSPFFSVVGYGYWLDLDDAPEAAFFSSRTIGTRVNGGRLLGSWSLSYAAEYARQASIGDNPNDYGTDFYGLEVGLQRDGLGIRVGYELYGGSNEPGRALQAPIARAHPFRGWADKFVVTPPAGVEDFYIAADVDFLRGRFVAAYHDFSAETGGVDYGDELDLSLTWRIAERYGLFVGLARYNAKGFSTDTDKVWLILTVGF